jgi:hypothetical protein
LEEIRRSGAPFPPWVCRAGARWETRNRCDTLPRPLKYAINHAMFYGMTTSVEELIRAAADARRIAQRAIALAVREARAADWSWDQISAALGGKPNGETLRRNFSVDE